MRLAHEQIEAIRQSTAEVYGSDASVWLFGSRVDDNKRGGDIDLLIVPGRYDEDNVLLRKLRFLSRLERQLGERKIDVIVEIPGDPRPIVEIAHQTGVRL